MAQAAALQLEAEKSRVDALNVFPVPDGDTGTNMSLTLWSAVDAVLNSSSSSLGELADSAAQGALMGARGNSGVILSQFLRGFANSLAGMEAAGPVELAQALVDAAEAGYEAVIKPVEGTVLTVGREAAQEALKIAETGGDLNAVLQGALAAAMDTLARTPEILITLKEAGVVDAGGEGLVVAARGAFEVFNGSHLAPLPTPATGQQETALPPQPAPSTGPEPTRPNIQESSGITYQYCTEFLVRGSGADRKAISKSLKDLGDSMMVVGQGDVVKVHVHTNHPGLVLELCGARGELLNIHINNMVEQNRQAALVTAAPSVTAPVGAPEVAVVAVATGDGWVELLKSLGALVVVEGGQTNNPSTKDLLDAIEATGAKAALVLPNNGNVLMTARQAAHLAGIPVNVVPTRSFCQGVAALLRFSPEESLSENARRMETALDQVACGEVTVAVRDARVDSIDVCAGDYMGIGGGRLLAVAKDLSEVTRELVGQLMTEDSSLLTLYFGQDVGKQDAEELAAEIGDLYGLDVEVYKGGQPVYPYLLSVE